MATINAGGAVKVRVLLDSKIVVEPVYIPPWVRQDEAKKAKWLESWCQEFMDFMRDHRHQDINSATVDRTYQEQCSKCRGQWEEMIDDDGDAACATCGEKMEVVR